MDSLHIAELDPEVSLDGDASFSVAFEDGTTQMVTVYKPAGFHPESIFVLMRIVSEAEKQGGTVAYVDINYGAYTNRMPLSRKQIMGV